jgi:hypothetical protein
LTYCRQLQFEETPDYGRCRGYFERVLASITPTNDTFLFDWQTLSAAALTSSADGDHPVTVKWKLGVEEEETEVGKRKQEHWLRQWFCFC